MPADVWNWIAVRAQEYLGISPETLAKIAWTLVVWGIYQAARWLGFRLVSKRIGDMHRKYIANKTVGYILGIAAAISILRIWLGGFIGLAAYFGILSAGLAIALQDPLSNLAGWLFITLRKPFVVGDRIEIGGHAGDVIDIRPFQFSMVEIGNWVDADQSTGRIIHIPNGWAFKQSTANYSQGFNFIWHEVPITVTFESDWKKAKGILTDIANRHSAVQSGYAENEIRKAARQFMIFFQHLTPIVWTSVAGIGVTLTMRYLCEPRKRRSTEQAVWEDVLTEFALHDDIDFAYPTTRFYDNALEGKAQTRPPAQAGRGPVAGEP